MYIFDTHYGKCCLADEETRIEIHWEAGAFNDTQQIKVDEKAIVSAMAEGDNLAIFMARKLCEMGDYIHQNYPELV